MLGLIDWKLLPLYSRKRENMVTVNENVRNTSREIETLRKQEF